MKASLFKWLGIRRIYLIDMKFLFIDDHTFPSSIENNYVDQFRYTQHVVMRGPIRDHMAIFLISNCLCLLSIYIFNIDGENPSNPQVTDHTLQSIVEHCIGLQSLSLIDCEEISDYGLITISEQCCKLLSLRLFSDHITDASIKSISTNCTGLQELDLVGCSKITDASMISISTHCNGLQFLSLEGCHQITDASIVSISTHCTGLQALHLYGHFEITDASIISISTHCKNH